MGKKIIGVTVGTPIKPDLVGGGSDVDLSEYVKNTDYENNKSRYVKEGLTANTETLTEEEKAKACEWLGVNALVGNIEIALDNIIAIQENLIGGGNV